MESFEQTASADNLTTNAEAKQTVEAMVNNVLSEAMMNLERQDKKRGGSSSGQESNDNDRYFFKPLIHNCNIINYLRNTKGRSN